MRDNFSVPLFSLLSCYICVDVDFSLCKRVYTIRVSWDFCSLCMYAYMLLPSKLSHWDLISKAFIFVLGPNGLIWPFLNTKLHLLHLYKMVKIFRVYFVAAPTKSPKIKMEFFTKHTKGGCFSLFHFTFSRPQKTVWSSVSFFWSTLPWVSPIFWCAFTQPIFFLSAQFTLEQMSNVLFYCSKTKLWFSFQPNFSFYFV